MEGNNEEVKVEGVFGGVEFGENAEVGGTVQGGTIDTSVISEGTAGGYEFVAKEALPVKSGFWSKVKAFLFTDINVELTPHQQKVEKEINDFLYQDITWGKVKSFLFKEIKF